MEFSKKACQHSFFGCNAYNQSDQIGPIFIANWATFYHGKSYALILTKVVWAIFWVIFSQIHLVTLDNESAKMNTVITKKLIATRMMLTYKY
jgi:hypothetical protein